MTKNHIVAILMLASSFSFAAPFTCVPMKVKVVNHHLVLEGASASTPQGQLYFFKNTSKQSLWLDRLNKKESASAGWSSYLRPTNWTALLLDKKEFTLSCAVLTPGKVDYVNCGQAISVCTPAHAALTTNHKGSYWVAEDLPWDVFVKMLSKRGVK